MKGIICMLLFLISVFGSIQAQQDTINTKSIQVSLDSLEAHQQAQLDVPYFKWFAYSMFLPGVTVLTSEVVPVSADTTTIKDPIQYKKTYKKERTEAAIYGSVIGVVMALWWGILIL